MTTPRTRVAALAGSLALSLALVSGPAALAQDGPEATIEGLLAAIEAKDFEALPSFFCPEFADQAEAFDLSAMTEGLPPGVDAQSLLDAFILDAEITSNEVVSQSDTEAVVMLEGSLSMAIDTEALVPFIEAVLEASGMDVTPETVDLFTGMMATEFEAASLDIAEEITLVPGDTMAWVVCDDLGTSGAGDDMTADETDDAMSEDDGTAAEPEVTEEE